jgi:dethiobiotin synthetase
VSADVLRGFFVTGTDTGVGKTVVASAIVARLRRDGVPVRAFKPLITGLDDPADPDWLPDHELLALAAYGPPVSPHLAAELAAEEPLSPHAIGDAIRTGAPPGAVTVVEGVGGLLVPLGPGGDVRALAADLKLAVVIAARPGLGTINHTLLTVEAARAAQLTIAGVVMTPWPSTPSVMERSNRDTVARLAGVEVAALGAIAAPRRELLAAAADALPLKRWLPAGVG